MSTAAKMLVADAGHTRMKFAIVAAQGPEGLPQVLWSESISVATPIPWEGIVAAFQREGSEARAVLTGSYPVARRQLLKTWPGDLPEPDVIDQNSRIPVKVQVDQPEKVGVDRLLNALAANRLRSENEPALIVDTGTAVTVDCVSSSGTFLGGAILPGLRMGAQALHNYTSTLPYVEAAALFDRSPAPIGQNTQAAIASGLYWGHVGAVRELILRQRDQLAAFDPVKDAPPLVLVTGGAAGLLRPHLGHARFEPHLALQGLALAALPPGGPHPS